MNDPGRAVRSHIDAAIERGDSLLVTELAGRAREAGAALDEAVDVAVEAAADPDIQGSWVEWERISDQTELSLRLRVLLETARLRADLEEFVAFFFRASAPDVYRNAALALGRHTWTLESCAEHLRRYAEDVGVPLDSSVSLNGERSRRRLLLASTERFIRRPDDADAPEFPIADPGRDRTFDSPADLAALCIAAERLVDADCRSDAFQQLVWGLVEGFDRHLNRGGSQRGLVRAWGGLLRAVAGWDRQRAAEAWVGCLASFQNRPDTDFSSRLASHWEMDALLAVGVGPGIDLLEASSHAEIGGLFDRPLHRWLARIRAWQWNRRRSGELPTEIAAEEPPESLDPVLRTFRDEVVEAVRRGMPYSECLHRWIARMCERVATPEQWWGEPASSRAIAAFLTLDAVRFRPPPRETIRRLLESSGISRDSGRSREEGELRGLEGTPWEGFHDLLWHVFVLEGTPEDFPVESEALTSILGPERLLGFLRAGQSVRDADIVVDALEHFVRLDLAADPTFDHRSFLYRVAARKPHVSIFREFARRTRGRTYRTEAGPVVDLHESVGALAAEIEGGEELDSADGADWFPELRAAREALREVADHESLYLAVEAFADQIDPRIPDPDAKGRGLVDLVGEAVPPGEHVLLDSTASAETVPFEELVADVADAVREMRESADRLFEASASTLPEMFRAARNLAAELEEIHELLAPCLAATDAALVGEVAERLRSRLVAWTDVLRDVLGGRLEEGASVEGDEIDEVFEGLLRADADWSSRSDRWRLFRVTYELLADRSPTEHERDEEGDLPLTEESEWEYQFDLLAAAANRVDGRNVDEATAEFLSNRWEALAAAAMEVQSERGVERLAGRRVLESVREFAADSPTFERLEQWVMDRYRVGTLRHLIGAERAGRASLLPASAVAVGRLAANFGHVWLALLVGAVMLLDFGDAWVEMARAGDVGGIAATFGIGLGGTFLYLLVDISRKTQTTFENSTWRTRASRLLRALLFLAVCFLYALGVTSGLWYLFSGTEVVLHGSAAVLQILVWTGFALFVGVFFGLLTNEV